MGADELGGSCCGPGEPRVAWAGGRQTAMERRQSCGRLRRWDQQGLRWGQLEERALGRAGLPARFRHVESQVILRHPGAVGQGEW